MAEEEAESSALAHVGRTLNDELDTARMREKEREEVRERESRRGRKRKGDNTSLQPHDRLPASISSFFILDELNDVHKSIDLPRLSFTISFF